MNYAVYVIDQDTNIPDHEPDIIIGSKDVNRNDIIEQIKKHVQARDICCKCYQWFNSDRLDPRYDDPDDPTLDNIWVCTQCQINSLNKKLDKLKVVRHRERQEDSD